MINLKLRLKHPSGAEFEAEGPAEFILTEKTNFLKTLEPDRKAGHGAAATATKSEAEQSTAFWDRITSKKNDLTVLRIKPPGMTAREAALVLLAASKIREGRPGVSAITLSKAVKASGYAPARLDRLLAGEVKAGRINASGTKRNCAYAITDPGIEAAWLTARRLISAQGQSTSEQK